MQGPKARFLESTDFLPKTFDLKAIEKKRQPGTKFCMLCEAEFTKMFPANPIRHCKRCGKSICDTCSKMKRQLSQQDTEKHRVCDECDTLMDNYLIKQNHEEVIAAQTEKIENMNNMIVELDNQKQQISENFEGEKKQLEEKLQAKYNRKQMLEQQVVDMTYNISDLNAARNNLHEKMSEQEKDITHLKAEKARLEKTKQTIFVELSQKESLLEQRRIENEKLYNKLADLKSKRTA